MTVVQAASAQTRKLTVPVSAASGSLKVAVRVGVVVFGKAASAGVTRAGTLGRVVAAVCVAMGLANAVFFARFPYWHGDHTFGPRYLIMSIPFWVVPAGLLVSAFFFFWGARKYAHATGDTVGRPA